MPQDSITDLVKQASKTLSQAGDIVERSKGLAAAMKTLRARVKTELWPHIKDLKNNSLGFLTDEREAYGNGKAVVYTEDQLCDALTQGMILGGMPFNGEIAVIGGRPYLTKPCLQRLIRESESISDLVVDLSPPANYKDKDGEVIGAVVKYSARFNVGGVTRQLEGTVPIRVNARMGADAILGKAERKIYAIVLRTANGSAHTIPDGDIDEDRIVADSTAKSTPADAAKSAADRVAEASRGNTGNGREAVITPEPAPFAADPTPSTRQSSAPAGRTAGDDLDDILAGSTPTNQPMPTTNGTRKPTQKGRNS